MMLKDISPTAIPGFDARIVANHDTVSQIHTEDAAQLPWYASLFMAFGAWITALLGIGAVLALVDLVTGDLDEELLLFIGLFLLAASLPTARRLQGPFAAQLSLVTILAAQGLTVGASWAISEQELVASLVSLSISALIIWRHPIVTLSFLTTAASLVMLAIALATGDVGYWVDVMAVLGLGLGAYLWLKPPPGRDWTGVAFALLLCLPLLGIGLHLGESDSRHLNDLIIQHDRAAIAAGWVAKLMILAISLDALRRIQPTLGQRRGIVVGAILTALILAQPLGGAAATGLMTLGYLMASPAMMVLMGIAQIIAIGQFYYELDVSLLAKSGMLAVLGAIALIGWWVLWGRLWGHSPAADTGDNRAASKPSVQAGPRLVILGVLAALITGIAAQAVISRETIIAEGRQILLPLAPVDPRSLMQGDYMILRLDPDVLPAADTTPRVGFISLDIAEDGTVIGRSAPIGGHDGTISLDRLPGASAQINLAYHPSRGGFGGRGQLGYGIDSFFFQEGHAAIYQSAAYAVLRVSETGQAVLIGLADGNKQLIAPP